jgi:hypothetical protein
MVPAKIRSSFWVSGIAFGVFLAIASWLIHTAYNTELTEVIDCADDPSQSGMQWMCKKTIYHLRVTPDEVKELNSMAGAYFAVQLDDKVEAEKLLQYFLSRGVDINSVDTQTSDEGFTALHNAVYSNEPKEVELLLAHGAKADALSSKNQMPLELAKELQLKHAQEDRSQVIKLLVESGRPKYSGFLRRYN